MATDPLLHGLRVVEAASMILVPAAAAVMADFGAEVIKIEPPDEGDENRRLHLLPGLPASEVPYSFLVDNRGKKSVALDLKDPAGIAVLERLVAGADVFLTNYRASALERLGLTDGRLRALNPRLVYANATGFGEAGPEAGRPAYDTVSYWSRSGLEAGLFPVEGWLGRIPPGSGDHPTAMALFGAIMLGLFSRERTGRGLKVSTSLLASGVWTNACSIQARLCGATFPPKRRREDAPSFGSVYYRTRDARLIKFSMVNPTKLWHPFCRAIGRPELADDARFATLAARGARAGELIALLDEVFAAHDLPHWQAALDAEDIPYSAVATYDDLVDDPQLAAAGVLVPFDHPRYGRLASVDSPITVAGHAKVPPRPAPDLGEHTLEVLRALGLAEEEVQDLLARGVARQAPAAG